MIAVDGRTFRLEEARRVLEGPVPLELDPDARDRMEASHRVVRETVRRDETVYGVNTGFGRLADTRIDREDLERLQVSLVRSHAAGVGDPLPADEVRLVLTLKANGLAGGLSGCRPLLVDLLCTLVREGCTPVIPERGSVGASGDLAPLAHLALVLIGEGEAFLDGERLPGDEALDRIGAEPLRLGPKEGLALVNGTQVMTALGVRSVLRLARAVRHADLIGALTLDALRGTDAALDPRIHRARPHPGQLDTAASQRSLIEGSEIRESHRDCPKVQDAYSLRCMPQVHGACRDAVSRTAELLGREMNAATDNPLVFLDEERPEGGTILSGGNFHGAPVALGLDHLGIAASTLGAIGERRVERLVNPDLSGLTAFLAPGRPGLSSGLMLAQVTAAALASENKVLAHPASADSIPTSANQEDHVSMGVAAALKLRRIVDGLESILATELVAAGVAIEEHAPRTTSPPLVSVHRLLRERVPPLTEDRPPAPDLEAAARLIRSGRLLEAAAAEGAPVRRAIDPTPSPPREEP